MTQHNIPDMRSAEALVRGKMRWLDERKGGLEGLLVHLMSLYSVGRSMKSKELRRRLGALGGLSPYVHYTEHQKTIDKVAIAIPEGRRLRVHVFLTGKRIRPFVEMVLTEHAMARWVYRQQKAEVPEMLNDFFDGHSLLPANAVSVRELGKGQMRLPTRDGMAVIAPNEENDWAMNVLTWLPMRELFPSQQVDVLPYQVALKLASEVSGASIDELMMQTAWRKNPVARRDPDLLRKELDELYEIVCAMDNERFDDSL